MEKLECVKNAVVKVVENPKIFFFYLSGDSEVGRLAKGDGHANSEKAYFAKVRGSYVWLLTEKERERELGF